VITFVLGYEDTALKNVTSPIIRLPAVMGLIGLGRDTIYRLARQGKFPKPIKLGERASGWYEHEVVAWGHDRAALRRGVK
jgi:prophage regulatory protein